MFIFQNQEEIDIPDTPIPHGILEERDSTCDVTVNDMENDDEEATILRLPNETNAPCNNDVPSTVDKRDEGIIEVINLIQKTKTRKLLPCQNTKIKTY